MAYNSNGQVTIVISLVGPNVQIHIGIFADSSSPPYVPSDSADTGPSEGQSDVEMADSISAADMLNEICSESLQQVRSPFALFLYSCMQTTRHSNYSC